MGIGLQQLAERDRPEPDSGAGQEEENQDKKQLNLTVGITYKGLFIAGVGGIWGGSEEEGAEGSKPESSSPTIPLLTADPVCRDAMAKKIPPPVSCYDFPKLTAELNKIKDVFPKETKVILYAQPDVPYEVLVKVMDATREDGGRALFFDVILSPEIG